MFDQIKQKFPEINIFVNEPLKKYTFTKVGGIADYLIFPKNIQEVQKIVFYANIQQIPWQVLGNASNLIVRDGGIRGIVMILTQMDQIKVDGVTLAAQAGAKLIDLSQVALFNSLTGLEFACGIPGSVGGALFMNAGAYGGEISQVFISCQVMNAQGIIETWDATKINFGYRKSLLQNRKAIVLNAKFELESGDQELIKAKMEELDYLRRLKQPLEYPSCGSVFKRPQGYFTGKLIQESGLQGYQIGGAQVSTKHAGFIVNTGTATASDYENLISYIIDQVFQKFSVRLQPEVKIIGEKIGEKKHAD